jgi:mono/diheme cytochrome c family protein
LTEVPEHLLRRSRERREALGLSSGDAGGSAPAGAEPAAASAAEAEAAPAAAAAAVEPAAPVEPEPVAPPPPPPPYIEAAQRRTRIPVWAMPVVALLPVWAFVYAGTLDTGGGETSGPLALGAEVYAANCASCHGAGGGGGTGPALSGGEVLLTFPDQQAHIDFVAQGSAGIQGDPYGAPDRPGGQRIAETGGMPAWEGVLSPEELQAVVLHERVVFGGEEPPAEGEAEPATGEPGDAPPAEGSGDNAGAGG